MLSSVDLELIDQKQRTLISWDSNPWNAFLHYVTDSESALINRRGTNLNQEYLHLNGIQAHETLSCTSWVSYSESVQWKRM